MRRHSLFALSPFLVLWAFFSLVSGNEKKNPNEPLNPQVEAVTSESEVVIKRELETLLSPMGIKVKEPATVEPNSTYHRIRIIWDAYPGESAQSVDPQEGQLPIGRSFVVVDRIKANGSLPRVRRIDLSPEHIFVAALDAQDELTAWTLVPDPRLVRMEAPGAGGKLSGKTQHRTKPEFFINISDDQDTKEIRFYYPKWNGVEFSLYLIGSVPF